MTIAGTKTRDTRTNSDPAVMTDEPPADEAVPDGPARITNMLGAYEEVVPVELVFEGGALMGEANKPGKRINASPTNTPNVKLSPTLLFPASLK